MDKCGGGWDVRTQLHLIRMSEADKMCNGPGAVTGIHAIVYYHQKVRKVKLKVPDDLGETKLFGVIKSLLSLPQDHQISISRYSKSKQRYVYLSSQAEFSALLRCATVKKRFSFIVTDVEPGTSTGTTDAVATDNGATSSTPSGLSSELVGQMVRALNSNEGFRKMLDGLIKDGLVRERTPDVATTSTATLKCGGDKTGGVAGWPVDDKSVVCNECGEGIAASRHKCVECRDYDLCSACFEKMGHEHGPQHGFYCLTGSKKKSEESAIQTPVAAVVEEKPVHRAFCDKCGNGECIVGPRFKCLVCDDFDLCDACFQVPEYHDTTHSFVRLHDESDFVAAKEKNTSRDLRHQASCDGCKETIAGARYVCRDCADFDYCSTCMETRQTSHPESHTFIRARTVDDVIYGKNSCRSNANHTGIYCDKCKGCIYGMRYKCLSCADYDLCSNCIDNRATAHSAAHSFVRIKSSSTDILCGNGTAHQTSSKPPQAASGLAYKENEQSNIHAAFCDKCDKRIVGVRYRCDDCVDFDLCSECFPHRETTHPDHTFIAIKDVKDYHRKVKPAGRPVHDHVYCDGPLCKDKVVIIKGVRYKCAICHDTDFCAACESSPLLDHDPTHPLIKLKVAKPRLHLSTEYFLEDTLPVNKQPQEQSTVDKQPEKVLEKEKEKEKEAEEDDSRNSIPDFDATLVDFSCHANGCLTWVYKNTGSMTWPRYTSVSPSSDEDHRTETIRWTYTPFATHPGGTVTFTAFTDPNRLDNIPKEWVLKTPGGKEFGHRDFAVELSKSTSSSSEDSNVVLPMLPKESPSSSVVKTANSETTESVDDDFVDFSEQDEAFSTDDGNFEVVELSELSD